jgi:hypothetical protein
MKAGIVQWLRTRRTKGGKGKKQAKGGWSHVFFDLMLPKYKAWRGLKFFFRSE